MIRILKAALPADIDAIAELAGKIWKEHYAPIIGMAQVDYMLARFQSAPAIAQQVAGGYEYYVVADDNRRIGYFALLHRPAETSVLLSKLYVERQERGRGAGKSIVEFTENRCRELGARSLWLTVNRNNAGSIAFYRRMGFAVAGELVQDIGNGFVMDDYRMEKTIGTHSE